MEGHTVAAWQISELGKPTRYARLAPNVKLQHVQEQDESESIGIYDTTHISCSIPNLIECPRAQTVVLWKGFSMSFFEKQT